MNALEHIDVGALAKVMDSADATKGVQMVKQIKALAQVMQGYQFVKQLEKLTKEYPEIEKVGVVCVQNNYNDEGLCDGVYMDVQVSMTDPKTGQKHVSKMLAAFDPEDYDAVRRYRSKTDLLMVYLGASAQQEASKESSFEESFKKHVASLINQVERLFDQSIGDWHTQGGARSWLGKSIDMKNPIAVLQKVYDKSLVQYCVAQQQKQGLEQEVAEKKQEQKPKRAKRGL